MPAVALSDEGPEFSLVTGPFDYAVDGEPGELFCFWTTLLVVNRGDEPARDARATLEVLAPDGAPVARTRGRWRAHDFLDEVPAELGDDEPPLGITIEPGGEPQRLDALTWATVTPPGSERRALGLYLVRQPKWSTLRLQSPLPAGPHELRVTVESAAAPPARAVYDLVVHSARGHESEVCHPTLTRR